MMNVPRLATRLGLVLTALLLLVASAQPATALPVDELTVLLESQNEELNVMLDVIGERIATLTLPEPAECVLNATIALITHIRNTPIQDYIDHPVDTAEAHADYINGHYLPEIQRCGGSAVDHDTCSYSDTVTWLTPPVPSGGDITRGKFQVGVPIWHPKPSPGDTNTQQLRVAIDLFDSDAGVTC